VSTVGARLGQNVRGKKARHDERSHLVQGVRRLPELLPAEQGFSRVVVNVSSMIGSPAEPDS
jgi:hypothetical protein